ncbi:MAG: energy transducer TonB [bacterium]|nr:energy transducer TonB [bacterium]
MKSFLNKFAELIRAFARSIPFVSPLMRVLTPPALVAEDDRRLIVSAVPVLFVCAFVFAAIYSERIAPILSRINQPLEVQALQEQRQKVYRVLVEQEYKPEAKTLQERALSDVTAEGTGAITLAKGFHTLANDDTFEQGGAPATPAARTPAQQSNDAERTPEGPGESLPDDSRRPQPNAPQAEAQTARPNPGRLTRIPANYRFREDFALRYDGQDLFSIARQELVGYQYFRRMMRQIRDGFPLLGNWSYRDPYGVVVNEQVKPQVVSVQFLVDDTGRVMDVKVVSSIGQRVVDEACVNALQHQNFGPPPPEVLNTYGNIFGIRFLFPPPRY